ncbi:tRNA (adenosine(37)-N6)-threonylcarbamoyltransferase complex transferase subunit TsaD [Candidatus Roizmanbacteria bacterium]|nr:tRNA (adenosine(37)-N6)-threonylcarbamoyltransferase complex transferase subunit TsaD [Candidatus Roizmanbacteria bacterium]
MIILGIETSCDETSAAIIKEKKRQLHLKSNIVASSISLHIKTGGIIPENAAREQIKYILPVIQEALKEAKIDLSDVDAIAVTYGPGLIGSLLVGVETAKTISMVLNKPLIPVNHMLGHIYANFINNSKIEFPALALVVSGGHTDLLLLNNHGDFELLGGTRDDAAGEAFDKIGRLLGLPYPGGPVVEKRAKLGNSKRFIFPRPLVGSNDFDFSFSGLKTAVLREVKSLKELDEQTINDICAGVQYAIINVLIKKTLKAAEKYNVKAILLAGGVAANETLQKEFIQNIKNQIPNIKFFAPAKNLCTDNGAMIAAAAFYNYKEIPWQEIVADPQLYFI